jgi:hypothetical protein
MGDDDTRGRFGRVDSPLGEHRMRWVLRLIATGDDDRRLGTDLVEICRSEGLGDIASLGLTLPEAKQLLASVQQAVVSKAGRPPWTAAAMLPVLRRKMSPEGLAGALPRNAVRRSDGPASQVSVSCLQSHRDGLVLAIAMPINT